MKKKPHRTQPILNAARLDVVALEVFTQGPIPFDDEVAMIDIDIDALAYGSSLARRTGLRVHCNVEHSTLVLVPGLILDYAHPGVVIELVERQTILGHQDIYRWVLEEVTKLRRRGALIAIDDVTMTDLERELIAAVAPEFIKVEDHASLLAVRRAFPGVPVIAERIETPRHAEMARDAGAWYLQGFWCDRMAAQQCETLDVEPLAPVFA